MRHVNTQIHMYILCSISRSADEENETGLGGSRVWVLGLGEEIVSGLKTEWKVCGLGVGSLGEGQQL